MNRQEIDHFASGGEKMRLAVRGLTSEDLLAAPDPASNIGRWSIQEVILHLSDCEQVYADRMKRIIAEDNPTLQDFDENKWAKSLHYNEQSAEDAIALFDLTRRQMGLLISKLPESAFARTGMHTVAGRQSLGELITKADRHLDHHLSFIHRKRAAMGKEMW